VLRGDKVLEKLPESIEAASRYFRAQGDWTLFLGTIFERLKTEVQPKAIQIADIFRYQEWVLQLVMNHYSIQELAELELDEQNITDMRVRRDFFYRVLLDPTIPLDVTPTIEKRLTTLITRYSKSEQAPVLRGALPKKPGTPDPELLLGKIMGSIDDGTSDWKTHLDDLLKVFDGRPATVALAQEAFNGLRKACEDAGPSREEKQTAEDQHGSPIGTKKQQRPSRKALKAGEAKPTSDDPKSARAQPKEPKALAAFIRDGTPEQKRAAISFIASASQPLKKVSFLESVRLLINNIEPGCTDEAIMIDCIEKSLIDVAVLAEVITVVLENGPSRPSLLQVLYLSAVNAPPQRLLLVQKVFVQKLAELMIDPDPETRAKTTSIFAEFHRKIPRDFRRYLKRFAPAQERIVELRADQAAAREKALSR
jgi:hypothetical protein